MIRFLFNFWRNTSKGLKTSPGKTALLFISLFAYSVTGFLYFEIQLKPDLSWGDAIWWSFVTMTTVGYGDLFPETIGGRLLVGVPTMVLGVSVLGYILSIVTSYMLESKMLEVKGMVTLSCSGHITICRFNDLVRFSRLVDELRRDDLTKDATVVLVDDRLDELPVSLRDRNVLFVRGNPALEETLLRARVEVARWLIIQADQSDLAHSDYANLPIALTVETINPDIYSVVEVVDPENRQFFNKAHCNSVVCLSSITSQIVIQELQDPGVNQIITEITCNQYGQQIYLVAVSDKYNCLEELKRVFKQSETLKDAILMGVSRAGENFFTRRNDFLLQQGDRAIIISHERPEIS